MDLSKIRPALGKILYPYRESIIDEIRENKILWWCDKLPEISITRYDRSAPEVMIKAVGWPLFREYLLTDHGAFLHDEHYQFLCLEGHQPITDLKQLAIAEQLIAVISHHDKEVGQRLVACQTPQANTNNDRVFLTQKI